MSIRFRKSINLGGGVKLNIGKGSVGVSAGVRGARVSVNSKGRKTTSVGIPGSGLSYVKTETIGAAKKQKNCEPQASSANPAEIRSEAKKTNVGSRVIQVVMYLIAAFSALCIAACISAGTILGALFFIAIFLFSGFYGYSYRKHWSNMAKEAELVADEIESTSDIEV